MFRAHATRLELGVRWRFLPDCFAGLIKDGRVAQAQSEIDSLVDRRPMTLDGRRALSLLCWKLSQDRNMEAALDRWCQGSQAIHSAYILRGLFRIHKAWWHRGSGWGYTVTEEGGRAFRQLLEMAKTDLETAYGLNRNNPNSASTLTLDRLAS